MATATKAKKHQFSQKQLQACASTIRAYDKLIATRNVGPWSDYGNACRLCNTVPNMEGSWCQDCNKCPLHASTRYAADTDIPCGTKTFDDLSDAIGSWERVVPYGFWNRPEPTAEQTKEREALVPAIIKAAKARRTWLIKRFDKNAPDWRKYYTDKPKTALAVKRNAKARKSSKKAA